MRPVVAVLRRLGGSATVPELYEAVVEAMKLDDEQLSVLHDPERGTQTEAAYRMGWARSYLKKVGYLSNSERGVWVLTSLGLEQDPDPVKVVAEVRAARTDEIPACLEANGEGPLAGEVPAAPPTWQEQLIRRLHAMRPDAFERLCQRLLRESGFVEVKVTGRTGDGGIDGIGILRLQRVVSFQVLFQCKKWKGTVGAKEIRDFRGAMVGRSDKGLFVTTGAFTRGAQEEATRDGAPPIDLVDGERLVELLKELGLGVRTERIERVMVEDAWFEGI